MSTSDCFSDAPTSRDRLIRCPLLAAIAGVMLLVSSCGSRGAAEVTADTDLQASPRDAAQASSDGAFGTFEQGPLSRPISLPDTNEHQIPLTGDSGVQAYVVQTDSRSVCVGLRFPGEGGVSTMCGDPVDWDGFSALYARSGDGRGPTVAVGVTAPEVRNVRFRYGDSLVDAVPGAVKGAPSAQFFAVEVPSGAPDQVLVRLENETAYRRVAQDS